ncbi:MAG: ferritin family protein [Planctomycetota bacterium]
MDKSITRVVEALKKAMQAEQEGNHFYLMAASQLQDPKGQQVFRQLAEDEVMHFNFLRSQYSAFTKTGKADASLKLPEKASPQSSHPIFSDAIKSRIGNAHYEMTALSVGAQLELSAVRFYEAEAKAAVDDPVVQKFFHDLAEWEREHLTALQSQSDMLKEAYWNEGGFSPF